MGNQTLNTGQNAPCRPIERPTAIRDSQINNVAKTDILLAPKWLGREVRLHRVERGWINVFIFFIVYFTTVKQLMTPTVACLVN
jgi:hypothetical protein